jgi:hypothetical protein
MPGDRIMKYQQTIILAALCTLLGACNVPDTMMENGAVTLKGNVVTLHVDGAPNAMINAQGELQIGDKTVATTPSQQGLLILYFEGITDVHESGVQMGKLGTGMGIAALKDKLNGDSKSDQDKDAQKGGDQMSALSTKICQDELNIKNAQNQLAAQIPAFKPYGNIFTDKNTSCDKDDSTIIFKP